MKSSILFIISSLMCCINAWSQSIPQPYKGTPDTHLTTPSFPSGIKRHQPILGPDTFLRTLNYDSADAEACNHIYLHNQGQLMNMNYSFPTDTTGSYLSSSMFHQNYFCINSITVAFDSLFDPTYDTGFYSSWVSGIGIDSIWFPVIHTNYTGLTDTFQLQLSTVDNYGYPNGGTILDTMIIDSDFFDFNDSQIKFITWKLGIYPLNLSKFSVTIQYSGNKEDSTWFLYGYGNFTGNCQNGIYTLAKPTHFSPVGLHPFVANSFAVWNEYAGSGNFPTESDNNVFFPCDNDIIFKPDTDGANYLQNINIFATTYIYINPFGPAGVNSITKNPIVNLQNSPNPFTSSTTLSFTLSQAGNTSLTITDLTGRELLKNEYGTLETGNHSILLDGTNLSSGIYFYTLNTNGISLTRKMIIEK